MDRVQESVSKMKEILLGIRKDYVEWIVKNPSRASDMESSVKLISYLLHSRLKSTSIILPELIYCSSNLLAFWHDFLLRQHAEKKRGEQTAAQEHLGDVRLENGGPSSSAEYRANQRKIRDVQIMRVKSTLTILEYIEVFLEISAGHLWGDFGRWVIILIVQAIKTGLRAALLLHYKVGLIESPTQQMHLRSRARSLKQPFAANVIFVLKHSGRVIRKIHAAPPLNVRDWSMPSTPNLPTVPHELPPIRKLAEAIHLLRPLTHLMALGIFGTSSWKPWIVSATMDVASLQLHGQNGRLRKEEKVELTRRTYALCYYLIRSPFYDTYTKRKLLTTLTFLADRVPIVGSICGVLAQAIPEWQNTYSYMWTDN